MRQGCSVCGAIFQVSHRNWPVAGAAINVRPSKVHITPVLGTLPAEALPRAGRNQESTQRWRSSLAACIAAALLLFSTTAPPQAAPANPQAPAAAKKSAPPKATHLLHLTAVKLEGSGWTDERVLGIVRSAGRLLAQCGVKLERLELVSLAVPPSYLDLATPEAQRALARDYRVARPAVYFVLNTRSNPAFEAEAFGRGNTKTRPVLADTVWITLTARDPGIALAHELAHVLMDSGEHSDEQGNLMSDETTPKNTALTRAQCARLRDIATGNGLLKKAK